ncbi:MAG: hypothetical protein R3B96_13305 [Pirellulaceae bacterium]
MRAPAAVDEPILMPVEDEASSSSWDMLAKQLGVGRSQQSVSRMVSGWVGESTTGRANEAIDTVRVFGEPTPDEERLQKKLDSMFQTDSKHIPDPPAKAEPRRVIDDVSPVPAFGAGLVEDEESDETDESSGDLGTSDFEPSDDEGDEGLEIGQVNEDRRSSKLKRCMSRRRTTKANSRLPVAVDIGALAVRRQRRSTNPWTRKWMTKSRWRSTRKRMTKTVRTGQSAVAAVAVAARHVRARKRPMAMTGSRSHVATSTTRWTPSPTFAMKSPQRVGSLPSPRSPKPRSLESRAGRSRASFAKRRGSRGTRIGRSWFGQPWI